MNNTGPKSTLGRRFPIQLSVEVGGTTYTTSASIFALPPVPLVDAARGRQVTFVDAVYGPQSGTISNVLTDITNGRQTAIIDLDHALPGMVCNVPLDVLRVVGGDV